jgi:iron(III) transport system ATP-binding protein
VALSIRGVSHAFGRRRVVDDVSLDVGHGEIVCLLGPSGCGKTTLLRLAAGLEPLQSGTVAIGGRVVAGEGTQVPPEERRVGFVFQDFALFPHLDALGNIAFGLGRLRPAERRDRAMELLEKVGLAACATSFPHMLSGGEQQRIALARALAPRPRLMLLDEPFSSLDIRLREDIRGETLAILRDAGAASLVVTHDAEEALFMADRLAIMRDGRIVQSGTPDEVYRSPASAFVTRFLGPVTSMHGVVERGRARVGVGEIATDGFADGARVDVLVRPEGVRFGDGPGAVLATVTERHLLGADGIVMVHFEDGATLRARCPAASLPEVGAVVKLRVDPEAVFVFPCGGDPIARS